MRTNLALVKAHVGADYCDDDELLTAYIEGAESAQAAALGYSERALASIPDERWPAALRDAVLLRVAERYANREATSQGVSSPRPYGIEALEKPYCRLCGGGGLEELVKRFAL